VESETPTFEGVPVLDLLIALNSKQGAERLRATAILLRAGPDAVPRLVEVLADRAEAVMTSLWGEVLLQTVYATWLGPHLPLLQDAYFHRTGCVKRTLFETLGADAIDFWIACLCAPHWETREEAALVLGNLGDAASRALPALRDARRGEEHPDAERTMADAIAALERA
jgi:hypothetical protein